MSSQGGESDVQRVVELLAIAMTPADRRRFLARYAERLASRRPQLRLVQGGAS